MANSALFSRRAFLATSSAVALALPAGAKTALKPRRAALPKVPSPAAWRALKDKLKGPLVLNGEPDFFQLALPDNLRYAQTQPQGIARCLTTEDVATAITWARDNEIPLITRSGGHSYAGYSTTTGLMIDMTLMDGVTLDQSRGIAMVGGGAINQGIYAKLAAANVTITHGRCPSVGAAAFLLGGGIGFNMRENGLACDQMTATDLVKPNGDMLHLNARENDAEKQKIFWACQGGGGGNFGISTCFSLQTFAVPAEPITVFKIVWKRTKDWKTTPEEVGFTLMQTLEKAPPVLGSRVSFSAVTPLQQTRGEDVTVNLLGQFKGPKQALLDILAPVYKLAEPDGSETTIIEAPYWEGQKFLSEPSKPTWYQERSAFVNQTVTQDMLRTGFAHLRRWPGTHEYCDLRFFQTGAKVNAVGETDTAFVHRKSEWLMVVGLYWSAEDNCHPLMMTLNHAWQDGFYDAMLPFAKGGGAYQNFPDPSLKDWRTSYYGVNLEKLVEVKTKLDPGRLFNFPQAISSA
jgi:FAD/FMN-containing dehydrogenase